MYTKEKEAVKVKFKLTIKDVLKASLDQSLRLIPFYLILVVIFVFFTYPYNNNIEYPWLYFLISFLVTFPFIFILFMFISLFVSWNSFRNNKIAQEEQTYLFFNDRLNTKSDSSETNIKWDNYYKIIESKIAFYFMFSNIQSFVLPKRFLNEKQIMTIKKM